MKNFRILLAAAAIIALVKFAFADPNVPTGGGGGGGGSGGTVAQGAAGSSPWLVYDSAVQTAVNAVTTAINSSAIIPPTSVAPGATSSAASSLVLKASSGNLRSVYATNLTSTAGFLMVLNAASAPADGSVTPLACVPLAANGVASIVYGDWAPASYSTGITAVVSSAATCFTKTTGTLTAFISGSAY